MLLNILTIKILLRKLKYEIQRENFLLIISAKEFVSRIYTEKLQNETNNPISQSVSSSVMSLWTHGLCDPIHPNKIVLDTSQKLIDEWPSSTWKYGKTISYQRSTKWSHNEITLYTCIKTNSINYWQIWSAVETLMHCLWEFKM